MNRLPWLERVAEELARQGMPARVRRRLLDELRDHIDDLTEGGQKMASDKDLERQMGPADELAAGAAAQYRQSSWVRRHPLLVFGMAPVPLTIGFLALYLVLSGVAGYALFALRYGPDAYESVPRDVLERVTLLHSHTVGFVPFLALVVVFGRLAVKYRVSGWWLTAAAVQVAILGGVVASQVILSDVPGNSQFMVGFTLPPWVLSNGAVNALSPPPWRQLAQLVLPLIVGWVFLRAARRQQAVAA